MKESEKTEEKAEILRQSGSVLTTQNPMNLMAMALSNNNSIEVLERLMALQERWQAQQAKEAFFKALAEFQRKVPAIKKTKEALFDGKLQYKYADLSDVINAIRETAADCGIAFQWKINDELAEKIIVSCHISAHGHTEITTMSAAPDGSGKKNAIQSRGSAIEYMKRYTLAGALGLSISEDNDGGKLEEVTAEEIEIKATSFPLIRDMSAYYENLPKKWKNDPKIKKIFKDHEAFLKKQVGAGVDVKGGANA